VARGKLRLYLGAAPGVGKTYAMLNEGWRRKERGTDVVIGWGEEHGRSQTDAQIRDLPIFPRRTVEYRGQTFEEMDVAGLVERRGKQRLDSTQMLGLVARMSRLECVRETLRLALEELDSKALAFAKPGSLLLTGLTNHQIVRTSDILDITAIIVVRGKTPPLQTLELAEELGIPILTTKYILFEAIGRLYAKGIVGCITKVSAT